MAFKFDFLKQQKPIETIIHVADGDYYYKVIHQNYDETYNHVKVDGDLVLCVRVYKDSFTAYIKLTENHYCTLEHQSECFFSEQPGYEKISKEEFNSMRASAEKVLMQALK